MRFLMGLHDAAEIDVRPRRLGVAMVQIFAGTAPLREDVINRISKYSATLAGKGDAGGQMSYLGVSNRPESWWILSMSSTSSTKMGGV